MSSEAVIYETGVPLSIGVSEYDYDNNMDRSWEITSANGNDLQLTFTDFNVESQSSCAYDAVEIYTDDDSFEETFCGTGELNSAHGCSCEIPCILALESDSVMVRFRTDSSVTEGGFTLQISEVEEELFEGYWWDCRNSTWLYWVIFFTFVMSLIFCLRRRKSQAIENNALPTGIPVQHPLHMQQPANNAHLQGQQAAHFRQYSHSISYGGGSGQFHPAQFAQAIPMAQAVPGQSGQFHPQMAPPAYGNIPMAYDPSGGSGTYPNPYMAQMTNSNTNTGVQMESQAIPEGQAVGGQAVAANGGWQCGVCFQMNPEESSQCFSCSSFKPAY